MKEMSIRFHIQTLGCAKNEVDSEGIRQRLLSLRFISPDRTRISLAESGSPDDADMIFVNTCGFILPAKEESINVFFELAEYKEEGTCRLLFLIGCLAERYTRELESDLTEADRIIPISDYVNLEKILSGSISKAFGVRNLKVEITNRPPALERKTWKYVKIAEGCNNHCSYCTIPRIRGPFNSFLQADIEQEIDLAVQSGTVEIILIAQDTLNWGSDIQQDFVAFLRHLLTKYPLTWFRLLYLHPSRISDRLLETYTLFPNLVHYFDLPLQHINSFILDRMNRRTTKEVLLEIIDKIRKTVPDAVIRSTFIVGHPLEDQEKFEELLQFISEVKLQRAGFFPYSHEEDTPDYSLDPLDDEVIAERLSEISSVQQDISIEWTSSLAGKSCDAIIEMQADDGEFDSDSPYVYLGRTYGEAPDDDPFIYIESEVALNPGEIRPIIIYDSVALNPVARFSST